MLDFVKRCRTDQTMASNRKIWRSRCNCYRVIFSQCRWGPKEGKQAIPDTWYAQKKDACGWSIISKHKKKKRAFDACEEDASHK